MDSAIQVKAPAKINLSLNITGRRADGYHTMDMVMQTVSLYDHLQIELTHDRDILILCDDLNIPLGENSLIYRAVQLFYAKCMQKFSGVRIVLQKNIPIQAGLGGGSSDVAAVLVGLNALEHTNFSLDTLGDIGAKLGADVPFFITGGTCHVTGMGEIVQPTSPLPPCHILIVKPYQGVSTPQAFAQYDKTPSKFAGNTAAILEGLAEGNLQTICRHLDNVFTPISIVPDVPVYLGVLRGAGALSAQMSGTGSAIFGIFTEEARAKLLCERLKTVCPHVFLVSPIETGAEVVL